MLSTEIGKQRDGTREIEVCKKVINATVENVPGDPSKGYKSVPSYCNRPVVLNVSENMKMCPRCDKQAPIGNVHPRITNAAGVRLTPKELEECGVTEDTSLLAPVAKPKVKKPKEAKKAVEAKVKKEIRKDVVILEVPLSVLEENGDVAATLIRRTVEAFGSLPTTNFAESKRLIKLEEKLLALLAV